MIGKLESLSTLIALKTDLVVHREVNQFFYMQKIAELEFLLNEHEVACKRIADLELWLEQRYHDSFHEWKKDLRWIEGYGVVQTKK